jgi:predicted DNA-binding transcriptional regulator AlpA
MHGNTGDHGSTDTNSSYCKDEHFVAKFFAISLATVRRWRYIGKGPRYKKVGALVRYSMADLNAWLASRPSGGEAGIEVGK